MQKQVLLQRGQFFLSGSLTVVTIDTATGSAVSTSMTKGHFTVKVNVARMLP